MTLLISCSYKKEQIKPVCDLPDVVSFSNDILPIFNANCGLSGCHSGSSPEGNLDLTTTNAYAQLTSGSSGYVDTVNPELSVLIASMRSVSDPMPPSGNLDDCNINLIMKWIGQSAPNN
ncbi:MAG TPA: hypothetical protein PKJ62_05120 [Bacteroidia bacterium]|nr:hypothetical protein [Bacteroidia bacterium]HNS12580.1 hypothetical protein [Bacteroidia bacterium]